MTRELKQLTDAQIKKMGEIRFWHRTEIGVDVNGKALYTPGEVFHGPDGGDWPTTRFGLPADLTGKTVIDIGAWDGFFSFEAENRGASRVVAVDIPQESGGNWGGTAGFNFTKAVLGSNVEFYEYNVDHHTPFVLSDADKEQYDLVLCYGVLYHCKNPFEVFLNFHKLCKPGGTILLETTRDPDDTIKDYAAWCFIPDKDGDPTNTWYPTIRGLRIMLEWLGFQDFEVVHDMGSRVTVRITKPLEAEVATS